MFCHNCGAENAAIDGLSCLTCGAPFFAAVEANLAALDARQRVRELAERCGEDLSAPLTEAPRPVEFPLVRLDTPDMRASSYHRTPLLPPPLTPATDLCVMTLRELLKAVGDNAQCVPVGATLLYSIEALPGGVYRVKSAASLP